VLDVARKHADCRIIRHASLTGVDFENWAVQQARHPWILRIFPNERLNSELGRQVQDCLAKEPVEDGFQINRRIVRQGQLLQFGVFRNDAPLRLFRKEAGRIEVLNGNVELPVGSKIGRLLSKLTCELSDPIGQQVVDLLRQTDQRAGIAYQQGTSAKKRNALFGAAWDFLRSYVLHFGFRDGWAGLHASWLSASAIVLQETKLWEMQQHQQLQANFVERDASLKIFAPEQTARLGSDSTGHVAETQHSRSAA
jgi:hypothetical protein